MTCFHLAQVMTVLLNDVQVCERFSLPELNSYVCRSVGMARLQQGRLAAALQWLGRCGDAQAMEPAGRGLAAKIAEHAAAAVDGSAADSGQSFSPAQAHLNLQSADEAT